MENIALVTIKFPQNQTTTPDNTSTEECPTASSATQQTTPARSRPSTAKTTASLTKPDSASVQPSIGIKFLSAGLAACYADLMTFPLDTAKVRLQIQGEGSAVLSATRTAAAAVAAASPKYRGMFGTLMTISREEGVRALYNGLVPGLQRQMAFASIRIGLYDSVKHFYLRLFKAEGTVGSNNIGLRILAGITTGGLAVSCAQPTDVVKVRMQAAGQGPKRYKGCLHAYRKIAVEEGIRGLWKGVLPNITRNAIVNAAELVSYDLIKESIIRRNLLSDNMPCHFVSAFGAGFFATVVASPVDVVKTRFMNSGAGTYNGAADCAVKMFKEGGFFAFYKGFMPSYMRLGSWNIIMFVTFEQLKRFFVGLQRSDTISTTTTLADVSLQQKKLM